MNYTNTIKEARAAARDILRSEKVSALLGYIRNVKAKINHIKAEREAMVKYAAERVADIEHTIALVAYELNIASVNNHPDIAKLTEKAEKRTAELNAEKTRVTTASTKELSAFDERAEIVTKEHEDKIAEYEAKIEKWNTGESKVSYEDMVDLSLRLIRDKVSSDFTTGTYEGMDGDAEPANATCEVESAS